MRPAQIQQSRRILGAVTVSTDEDKKRAIRADADNTEQIQSAEQTARDAVETLYRTHVGAVFKHLRRGFGFRRADGSRGHFVVRSSFDAEEICQEAFAAFFQQWNTTFDRSRAPLPYLLRMASFMALRRARKTAAEVFTDAPVAVVAPVDNELSRLMRDFYDGLDASDQAVFDACFVEELSQAKAGDQLDRSRDQVYRSLTRIRQRALRFFKKAGWLDDA